MGDKKWIMLAPETLKAKALTILCRHYRFLLTDKIIL